MGGRKAKTSWFRSNNTLIVQAACERRSAYRDGNLAGLYDELWDGEHQANTSEDPAGEMVQVPRWAIAGARRELRKVMSFPGKGKKGPGASWRDRYLRDGVDYAWYLVAQRFRQAGVKGVALVKVVHDVFSDAGPYSGSQSAIRHAVNERVPKALRSKPGIYYKSSRIRDVRVPLASSARDVRLTASNMQKRITALLQTIRRDTEDHRSRGAVRGAGLRQRDQELS